MTDLNSSGKYTHLAILILLFWLYITYIFIVLFSHSTLTLVNPSGQQILMGGDISRSKRMMHISNKVTQNSD